jgi:drug/metabolite transporter (DMT)-like permease
LPFLSLSIRQYPQLSYADAWNEVGGLPILNTGHGGTDMDMKSRGAIEMTVAMAISGTIGWFVVMSGRPVLDVVFWRCVFGAVALLALCAWLGHLWQRISWRQFGFAVLGGVAIVLNWLLLFGAYKHTSIAIATAIYNTQPFMLLVFGAVMFSERITASAMGWLLLAFGGVVLITLHKPSANYVGGGDYLLGIVMALSASFGWAVAAVTTKRLKGVPPQLIALIHVCTGSLMLLPFAELTSLPRDAPAWSILATLGFVHTGLMYALMYAAVQRLPTHLQGALSFIYPAVAVLTDVVALGHQLHPVQIAGVIVILAAAPGTMLGVAPRRRLGSSTR